MKITRITALGEGKSPSTIKLGPGLNIIEGESNTGKSCIFRTIDFCFGSKVLPFDASLGYNKITLDITSRFGNLKITRSFDSKGVDIDSSIPNYPSGKYSLKGKDNEKGLNDFLFAAIGVKDRHKVIKNQYFRKQLLTWRTILPLILIPHQSIIAEHDSPILPNQATGKTAFLSSLIFLLSGNDYAEKEEVEKPEIRRSQKKAVKDFIEQKLQMAAKQKESIEKTLHASNDTEIHSKISQLVNIRQSLKEEIEKSSKYYTSLLKRIEGLNKKRSEYVLLQEQYEDLSTQYIADIKRLTNIVDGEAHLKDFGRKAEVCPFCQSQITLKRHKSYTNSANAELQNILSQNRELDSVKADLNERIHRIVHDLAKLQKEVDTTNDRVQNRLRPRFEKINEVMSQFEAYIKAQTILSSIKETTEEYEKDLENLPSDDAIEEIYHPVNFLKQSFQSDISALLKEILIECHYPNLNSASFDVNTFDAIINGHKKSAGNGNGYSSFVNTVMALAIRKYLKDNARFNPGLLIIDSPLSGLDQGITENFDISMRNGLFEFMLKHQDDGQIIIFENTKNTANLNYTEYGANIIHFDKESGRPGFLLDLDENS